MSDVEAEYQSTSGRPTVSRSVDVDIAALGREFAAEHVPADAMSTTEAEAIWRSIFSKIGITSQASRKTFQAKWAMIVAVNTTSAQQAFERQKVVVGGNSIGINRLFGNEAGELTRDNYRRFWRSKDNAALVQTVIDQSADVQSLLKASAHRQGVYSDAWRVACDICDRFTDVSAGELAEIARFAGVKQLKSNAAFVASHVPVGSVSGGDVHLSSMSGDRSVAPPPPASFSS